MRQRPWARLLAAVGGGIGLALTAPMLAAVGQISPPEPVLEIGATGRLVAQGAAVAIPVRVIVTCPAGGEARVSVRVVQAVDREVARAFGGTEVPCTGTPQDVEVFASSDNLTFRQGPAFASASLFCFSGPPFPGSDCSAEAEREIFLVGSGPHPPTSVPPTFPPPPTTVPPTPPPPFFPTFPFPDFNELLDSILDLFGSGFPSTA
ncbi:MAG: hypothetical protein ACR2KK_10520 [Acidimicrobiales bacterium]